MAALNVAVHCKPITASLAARHPERKAPVCRCTSLLTPILKRDSQLESAEAACKPKSLVSEGDRVGRSIAAGAMAAVLLALSPMTPSAALAADIPGASEEVQEMAERNMSPELVASLESRAQFVEEKKDKGYAVILFPTILLTAAGTIFVTAGGLSTLFASTRK